MAMTTLVLLRHATTPATGRRLGGWTPGVHLDEPGHVCADIEYEFTVLAAHLEQLPVHMQ